ncbi:hypothetical protein MKZ38_007274 [Zalerion maritima]|uniref:Citrate transporter-like domain-containing protein n=1 Tax=Zalerion maritima TaxID=339359 RepID=A0AAD5S334_9PEZI|nr:hypothetical protein MKZ38_007274 [Zalerion maritima]
MTPEDIDTNRIKEWRSIVTLVVFVITNIIVLFPFHIPVYLPRRLWEGFITSLVSAHVIAPREEPLDVIQYGAANDGNAQEPQDYKGPSKWTKFRFPMNFVTAPLIADLFLLAILAIGKEEVKGGTLGADNINPLDIMLFFITLAYIAISIDASGLIRYLAFKVLQWGGEVGHRLFLYLYAFFFCLGSFIGNDPIILSGTAFLAYMTRVSSNIVHPRAWIHTQFAVANIASAILVSSNPTNLVLAGAFDIKFIEYTANMIVPTIITGIVLFPFLLYIVFANESLIPYSIKMHELPEESKAKKPVNPNIPHARGTAEEEEKSHVNDEQGQLLSLEEIMNPFLDKGGAAFGAVVMSATLITLLGLNAASTKIGDHPVFWVTLPGAFVMLCWDIAFGWIRREYTRDIARKGRDEVERARVERLVRAEEDQTMAVALEQLHRRSTSAAPEQGVAQNELTKTHSPEAVEFAPSDNSITITKEDEDGVVLEPYPLRKETIGTLVGTSSSGEMDEENKREIEIQARITHALNRQREDERLKPRTFVSRCTDAYRWCQETFPTVTAVLAHLPFALIPFAFTMFILVQALVTKGWVPVFAHGWDHWVTKTGTVGAIGGMGFLSVILCNFAGTNIGTTILLSRVIQTWMYIHYESGEPISQRTFWATVYSMALGVNFGAFSTAFSASLAGLLWRDILARKHIKVKSMDFARVNLPIIAIAMTVGCCALVGQVYIMNETTPLELDFPFIGEDETSNAR